MREAACTGQIELDDGDWEKWSGPEVARNRRQVVTAWHAGPYRQAGRSPAQEDTGR